MCEVSVSLSIIFSVSVEVSAVGSSFSVKNDCQLISKTAAEVIIATNIIIMAISVDLFFIGASPFGR